MARLIEPRGMISGIYFWDDFGKTRTQKTIFVTKFSYFTKGAWIERVRQAAEGLELTFGEVGAAFHAVEGAVHAEGPYQTIPGLSIKQISDAIFVATVPLGGGAQYFRIRID
jgi:hypothetical protein